MNRHSSSWAELAMRETDGLAVWLLWSAPQNRVKVVVHDTRIPRRFELAVAPECALDAFHHPFLYAGPQVRVAAPTHSEEVAA